MRTQVKVALIGVAGVILAAIISGIFLLLSASGHPSTPTSQQQTLTIRAYIDGRSDLIFQHNTVHWHHLDWAAPGRLNGKNYPTSLNGAAWSPTWPDTPTPENRYCYCDSSSFTGIPQLPARPQTVDLTIVSARESVSIIQQPDASNGYTLIVEFNDNRTPDADWYEITLTYSG